MRTSEVTPRYGSYQESKRRAFSGASGSPWGGGMSRTMRSSSSSMPMPILAEVRTASSAGMPTTCSICSRAFSGSAEGRSILLMTGHDREVVVGGEVGVGERLRLDALRRVHDEHGALAGRERARDLVGEVDVARRVDQVQDVLVAVLRRVPQGHRPRLDRDARAPSRAPCRRASARASRARSRRPQRWRMRSDSVVFPWSMWATIEKLRMKLGSVIGERMLRQVTGVR